MPCYAPLRAFRTETGDVSFTELRRDKPHHRLEIPCGQCIGCRLERSRQWAIRCQHEAQLHEHNTFVTLTYNDEHLPPGGSLDYRDFQLFMKRLRKSRYTVTDQGKVYLPVRFYMCGEYGDQTQRAHYHACLFGVQFPDQRYHKKGAKNSKIYTSAELDALWQKGHCTLGAVTFESAAYTARYIMKKQTGDAATAAYTVADEWGQIHERIPPFAHMSLKPGIGGEWYDKFHEDIYPRGEVVTNGKLTRPPKYYERRHKKADPLAHEELEWTRLQKVKPADQTERRLNDRKAVAEARIRTLARNL